MSLEDAARRLGGKDWRIHRTKAVLILCAAPLVAVGVALLVGKLAGYGRVLDALREADWRWFPLCVLGEVAAYVGYILAFRDTARAQGGVVLPRRILTRVVLASVGATRLAAAGGAGGLAVDYWALRRAGRSVTDALVRVLALNTLLYACFGALAWVAALLLLLGVGGSAPLGMTIPWIAGVGFCVVAAAWVSAPARAGRLTREGGGWMRQALAVAVRGVVLVRHMAERPRRFRDGLAGAPMYWAGDILCLAAALRAFNLRLSLPVVVLAYTTAYLTTLLPLPTGAEGGMEAAMTFSLHVLGAPLAPALLGVIAYRFFSFWLPTIPALAVLPTLGRIGRDLEAHARATQGDAGPPGAGYASGPAADERRPEWTSDAR